MLRAWIGADTASSHAITPFGQSPGETTPLQSGTKTRFSDLKLVALEVANEKGYLLISMLHRCRKFSS